LRIMRIAACFLLLLALPPLNAFHSPNLLPSVSLPLSNPHRFGVKTHIPQKLALPLATNPPLGGGRNAFSVLNERAAGVSELANEIRDDFPTLKEKVHGDKELIYLDSAATSHKPEAVLKAIDTFYRESNSNVHRGAHQLSVRATDMYEDSRLKVANFINADRDEIVFTRGATEALNLVAYSWGLTNLKEGDEVILSVMEHHSNIVPWQIVAEKTGCKLRFIGLDDTQSLDMAEFHKALSPKTKMVSLVHVSNTLGCINPVDDIIKSAHAVGAIVCLDACQSVPHMKVDVRELDCDFLVASGHKMCGPTGCGFLYGKREVLEGMPPWQGGGEMIDEVFLDKSTYAAPPGRFEAGTPAIAQCIGLGAACDYLSGIGMDRVYEYECLVGGYLYDKLHKVAGVTVYGPPLGADGKGRAALTAFNHESIQHSDLSTFIDMEGVAIRSGHHCTQPLHRELGVSGSCRASTYLYTTLADVDKFIDNLQGTIAMFASLEDSMESMESQES